MKTEVLDLREDFRQGRPPFAKIMAAAARVDAGDALMLVTPFEPVPLFGVLAQQGFSNASQQLPSGDWEIQFIRQGATNESWDAAEAKAPCGCSAKPAGGAKVEVDTRGMEPPQPLVTILEALAALAPGAELHARTGRRPMHLYPQLEARGFAGETEEQSDGSFITIIRRS